MIIMVKEVGKRMWPPPLHEKTTLTPDLLRSLKVRQSEMMKYGL